VSTEQKNAGKIEQLIKEGIAAAKAGDKATARTKLREAVALDQYSEKGWFWLASVVDSEEERRVCLGNVVVINPTNERAQQMLDKLTGAAEDDSRDKTQSLRDSLQANPKTKRTLYLVLGGVVVLLLLVLVLFRGGGPPPPTPTEVAVQGSPATAVPTIIGPTPTLGEAEQTQAAGIAASQTIQAEALNQPTLPPSYTPSLPPRPRGTLTSTPLATPPLDVAGRLVAISGKALTLDKNLPLVLIDLTTREIRPLSTDRGDYGILSPNGKRIIFARYVSGTESLLLRVMNLNGTQPEEISALWKNKPPLENQEMVSLSRNGKALVFAAQNVTGENETTTGIYYLPVNFPLPGQEPTETPTPQDTPTDAPTATLDPSQTVQPTATRRPSLTPSVTVAPVQVKRLTEKNLGVNTWPDVSPDGQRVLFVADRTNSGGAGTDIYLMPVTGGAAQNITNDSTAKIEAAPQWSPDGSQIVFQAKTEDKGNNDIYLMNADGSGARSLATGGDNIRPRWSPDGKYIAFTSNRSGKWEIFIVEIQSGALYQLTSTADDIICTDWGR
jgi:hypothetical protein